MIRVAALMTVTFALTIVGRASATTVQLTSPASSVSVTAGTALTIAAQADEPTGTLQQHWLEIKRPAGDWNWEGWLISEPFAGGVNGSGYSSSKSGAFTFTSEGVYTVRSTAIGIDGVWAISREIQVTVSSATTVSLSAPLANATANVGNLLNVSGSATNPTGALQEHWLEVRRPAGDWNWEGWLISPPFDGSLVGNSSSSSKSGTITLADAGIYTIRTTAMDQFGNWKISNEVKITVVGASNNHAPTISLIQTSVVPTLNGKTVTVFSGASDVDGNLVTHFIGFSPSSPITPSVPTGPASSGRFYTVFIPTSFTTVLWAFAEDALGATAAVPIVLH